MGRVEYPSYRQTVTLANKCIASKVGGTVTVNLWPFTTTNEDTWEEVGVLPEGWRPSSGTNIACERGYIEVYKDGNVRCKRLPGNPANVYGSISFTV